MNKIFLIITVITMISCKQETPVDYVVVHGKITNKNKELTLNSRDRSIKEVIRVADDGSFSDTLYLDTNTYILFDGKNRVLLYLEKGNNINISFDTNDFENTIAISGKGSAINNYLLTKEKIGKEIIGSGTEVYLLGEKDYKIKFKKLKSTLEELIKAEKKISNKFKIKELRNINYAYLNKLNIYEMYHAHYAKMPEFKISEGFLSDLENLDYTNEEDFIFSSDYKNLIGSNNYKKAKELAKIDSISEDIAFLKIVGNIRNETIKNRLLFDNARSGITYTDDLETFYKTFISNSTNIENNKQITESYKKLKTVAKGQPSPKFENYENFAGGTTSLDDLKGRFVYVDVWATWCGPCKREIPFLKKLEGKYRGKNIEFVSVSVDKAVDHDKWKKMVKEKELKGIQLFSDKDWDSDFVKEYLIKGIPRFILIDPKGNIVNSNAPRPSDSKLIDLFNELKI
ncbi:TlpA disulfide reductase family protein [Lutibacter sp.]|uniref:TlpA family protein disulfide reductase n=1 Tax=Lutibacter sp. TaxID=1925666 RepID=UPI0025BBBCAD|nr:TlpA disulfide reductase family protein [Lutibacter sp.]MCF6169320.1 TlpA family protein disulfide reductase [Lutibacter sp.]